VSVAFDFNGMHFDEGLRVFASSREAECGGAREDAKGGDLSMNVEEVSSVVVDTAFHLHRDLGPGLHQTGSEQTSGLRVRQNVGAREGGR